MKFSIVIPAYNAEKYIHHCLDSVVNQDFPADQYEVIVVDDCSPDHQNDIIERYIGNYPPPYSAENQLNTIKKDIPGNELPNVRLIKHDRNKRQGGARNTGIAAAKGEWILFLDSDDYWCRNDVLSTFYKLINQFPSSTIIESYTHVDVPDWSRQSEPPLRPCGQPKSYSGIDFIVKSDHYSGYVWRSAYKNEHIKSIQFRENVFFEDGDWRLEAVKGATQVIEVDFPFYAYVNNPGSTIRGGNLDVFFANVDVNLIIKEIYLKSGHKDLASYGLSRVKSNILSWIKISREYPIVKSASVLRYASKTNLFDLRDYALSAKERFLLGAMKHCPLLLVSAVKAAVLTRRKIRKLYS